MTAPAEIAALMEQASTALVQMRYFECERLCGEALTAARAEGDFDSVARIMLPLQEARRQRRQAAAEAGVTVLTGPRLSASDILKNRTAGCLLLICPPYSLDDEAAVRRLAVERRLFIEVLALDSEGMRRAYEAAMEMEGDAAVAALSPRLTPEQRVDRLTQVLDRVGDHEIAHQRLLAAAEEAAHRRAAASAAT